MRETWVILPASCLFTGTKVTIADIAREWSSGSVMVCEKPNGSLGFIAGCGGDYGVKIGESVDCQHDQTQRSMGRWTLKNILNYSSIDGAIAIESPIPFDQSTKATIAVFK